MRYRRVPPSLHYREGNPDIDFETLPIAVAATGQQWPTGHAVAYASVNSFGFGGTNANVVLGEAIMEPEPAAEPGGPESAPAPTVLTFSARSAAALDELGARHAAALDEAGDLASYSAASALRRGHHEFRRAVVAGDTAEAAAKLRAGLVVTGQARRGGSGKIAFVFNGQGPQWYAMGRTLLETSEVYRDKIVECDRVARQYIDWSIHEALTADEESSRIGETRYLQPTMFALQVALAALWRSRGIEPDAVVGHSMGEIAAAHVSGALSLSEALKVICHRARIQDEADPTGGMMFVAVSETQAEELAARHPDDVWVSALNSPKASTLSGRRPVLEALATDLADRGIFARLLRVNCACHSRDMDPLREELLEALGEIAHSDTDIPLYSTLTGARIEGSELGTEYWWRNFRQPVLFESAIRAMLAAGYDTFIELSPHPVLANSVTEISADAVVVPSLLRKKDDWAVFLDTFARLYTGGHAVDWQRRYPAGAPVIEVPGNPWIRQSFWNESEVSQRYRAGGQRHPMLKPVDGARPTWEISWDDHRLSWVREHDVFGSVIVPGAAYIEAALAAAAEATGQSCALEFVEFERACVLSDEPQVSRLELDPENGTFEFGQRSVRGDTWLRNARGRFHALDSGAECPEVFDLAAIRERCTATAKAIDVYGRFAECGYAYGPAFCGIDRIDIGRGEALARITVPRVLRRRGDNYLFHPAVLDACFQSAILHPVPQYPGRLLPISYLPTGIERVRVYNRVEVPVWCYTRPRRNDDTLLVDIYLLDDSGAVVAEYTSLSGKAVRTRTDRADAGLDEHFYTLEWQSAGLVAPPERSAFTADPGAVAADIAPLAELLSQRFDSTAYATGYQRDIARLCATYVARCLQAFGPADEFTVAELVGLLPKYHRALQGLLRLLVDYGMLGEDGEKYRLAAAAEDDAEAQWAALFAAYPACAWELLLLRRTGPHLHEVLTGAADPLELLFADGSLVDLEAIYQNSPIARFYNVLGREVVRRLADSADRRRTIRVLEVGGGTGGLTASLLPVLPADRCEYVFTDISPAFLASARERFAGHDFVDYRVLDIEHDPAAQGIDAATFDLVVASDVVHATADAKKTLLFLQDMLAPGGMLMLLEATPGNPWLDLTFGLTEGWWSFRDQRLRPQTPLLAAAGWEELLRSLDFDDVVALGDPAHRGAGSQSVIVARTAAEQLLPARSVPAQPLGTWLVLADGDPLAEELAGESERHGGRAIVVREPGDIDIDEVAPDAIIDLRRGLGGPFEEELIATTGAVLDLLRRVCRDNREEWPRIVEVTRGAHAFRCAETDPAGAAVWGLAAVVAVELPRLRFTAVDLDSEPAPGDLDAILAEISADGREREVLVRGGERFVRRLESGTTRPDLVSGTTVPTEHGFVLTSAAPGALDSLCYHQRDRIAPAAGEVEIEVISAGLNFLDVMTALGQIPPLESATELRFGAECAGVITRVGSGVDDLRVGEAVVAVSPAQGSLGTHLTISAAHVVPKPETLGFDAAGSVPIVFLTAWYALHELARIGAGSGS